MTGPTLLAVLLAAAHAWAQYPGQVAKSDKDTPEMRAIAVVEWTGDADKPKNSRIVPVTVLDQGELQDGGIYLARPEPLALASEVEYELEQNGKPTGLFVVQHAGQEQGSWVGYGSWKALPKPRTGPSQEDLARLHIDDDVQSDLPVLHRKHHADDAPASGTGKGGGSGSGGTASSGQAPATDPDRPTLHKKSPSDSGSDTGTTSSSPAADPDRPTLHKKTTSDDSASAPASDPDRPVLKKKKAQPASDNDIGHVDSLPGVTDPDRPRLKRGKSSGNNLEVLPRLLGLPPDMHQVVAVSDAKSTPVHPWTYSWANPDDENRMKSALEDIARDALGLNPPAPAPAPAPTPTPKKTAIHRNAKPAPPPPPPPPAPLLDEKFRVFELAYGSGATLVLSAHTGGQEAPEKFVTLVAQPDLYGNVLVLLKSVTDAAHLDEKPRMSLVDAVDAMADNRGELLFELRGATQRQFALYRVLRGQAEKLFVSGGGDFGAE
ncbi:MAG: hypothetical protein P4K94_05185 [Terracidiphilus sp.]|nr:hypothetical protein [Terracidiphilus sp.]